MRVCFFGTYEETYPRNQILLKAMRKMDIQVYECHVDIWKNKPHKTDPFIKLGLLFKFVVTLFLSYGSLWQKYRKIPAHDLVLVGYPGHLDVLLIHWLNKRHKKPIVFDAFVSLYDTVALNRHLTDRNSGMAKMLRALDRTACQLSDKILLDTKTHIQYFEQEFGILQNRFVCIPAGADNELFRYHPEQNEGSRFFGLRPQNDTYKVLFIGKFTPLHGIDTILETAKLLQTHSDIRFEFIGTGQLYKKIVEKAQEYNLKNIEFKGWIEYEALPKHIQRANLCLGVFSGSDKASRIVANKVYQALACGKPVITAETSGTREFFRHRENIYFVPPESPEELAKGILDLKENPKLTSQIAEKGMEVFEEIASLDAVGKLLKTTFESVTK